MGKIRNYQIFSAIFVIVLGTLFHFIYQLSGENKIVAIFSSVNESVWEHMKLLFFPMLFSIIIGYFYLNESVPNFVCSKTIGILVAMALLVIFFYTYTGILGRNIAIVDITSFFIEVIIGEYVAYILMINNFKCKKIIAVLILAIICFCFIKFTFNTPKIGIFKDPLTGEYGIIQN